MRMKCVRCQDQRVIWEKTDLIMQHLFHAQNATKMEKQFERKLRPRKGVKTMQSPTALNKRGNKVTIDGYTFDSQKEANFYTKFVKNCGLPLKFIRVLD